MFKYIVILFLIIISIFIKLKDETYENQTIIFGSSLPKSGLMKTWGKNVQMGATAYFNYVNDSKLLDNHRKIKLIALDDKYEPELTKDNINKLLEKEDIFALFGFVGTPTVKNILPFLEDIEIPFIAPFTGASFLRNGDNPNFINFRSSYKEEIDKIVNYLIDKKKIKKIAVFYQNDTYGEEGYVSLIEKLKSKNLKLHGEGMYKRNTLSIKHAFSEIKVKKPEAIIMIGAAKANALFIRKSQKDKDLKKALFCNISFCDANEMVKEFDFDTKNIIFSQVVPSCTIYEMDVIKEYRYLMKRYFPKEPLSFISLESFLAAKTVVQAIKQMRNKAFTREEFIKQMKNVEENTLKGITLKYKNTQLLNKTYLFKYNSSNGKFEEIEND